MALLVSVTVFDVGPDVLLHMTHIFVSTCTECQFHFLLYLLIILFCVMFSFLIALLAMTLLKEIFNETFNESHSIKPPPQASTDTIFLPNKVAKDCVL